MRRITSPPNNLPLYGQTTPKGNNRPWSRKLTNVKTFVEWATDNQKGQCAYCGFFVGEVEHRRRITIDHFAPEKQYPLWRFLPENLLVSCDTCNSTYKQAHDTLAAVHADYSKSDFNLVHPYLDNVEFHVSGTYLGGDKRVKAPQAHTKKGQASMAMFRLNDPSYLKAINSQARSIGLAKWKKRLTPTSRLRYDRLLSEATRLSR